MADNENGEPSAGDDKMSVNTIMLAFQQLIQQQQETQKLLQQQQAENKRLIDQQQQQLRVNQVSAPQIASFDLAKRSRWEDWLKVFKRCEYFQEATTDYQRINKLVVAMGVDAAAEFHKLRLTTEQSTNFEEVIKALTVHFMGEQTLVYKRYQFNRRNQLPGETAKQFVAEARILAEKCKFSEMTDPESELLRDRLVCGITDQPLREALLADPKLTLEKVLNNIHAREQSHIENLAMGGCTKEPTLVERVTHVGTRGNVSRAPQSSGAVSKTDRRSNTPMRGANLGSGNRCYNCGMTPFNSTHRDKCAARSITCNNCGILGHFAKWCHKTKKVQAVQGTSDNSVDGTSGHTAASEAAEYSAFYIDRIVNRVESQDQFVGRIRFNNQLIHVKFNSGADVSVIPQHLVPSKFKIIPTDTKLCAAAGKPLNVKGCVDIPLANDQKSVFERFYVVPEQKQLLIGAPALQRLGLLTVSRWAQIRNIEIEGSRKRWEAKFPKLFEDRLGKIPFEYTIKVTKDAVPYSIPVARNVAIPLRPAVEKELQRMLRQGVVERVTKPTSWCAPMVVARKRNDDVRICTDFTRLNQFVRRPKAVLPDVESSLAAIGRSKIFTKLDAASGFWKVPLAEECRDLTTFITPQGRFRYCRLPFGITSAPEFFQKAMSSLLSGLNGKVCHMDDVVVHASSPEEHDRRLAAVLSRMDKAGLVLNPQKCVFQTHSIRFLGQIIEGANVKPDPERLRALSDFPRPTTVTGVRKLMGSLNQLAKFIPPACRANRTYSSTVEERGLH